MRVHIRMTHTHVYDIFDICRHIGACFCHTYDIYDIHIYDVCISLLDCYTFISIYMTHFMGIHHVFTYTYISEWLTLIMHANAQEGGRGGCIVCMRMIVCVCVCVRARAHVHLCKVEVLDVAIYMIFWTYIYIMYL